MYIWWKSEPQSFSRKRWSPYSTIFVSTFFDFVFYTHAWLGTHKRRHVNQMRSIAKMAGADRKKLQNERKQWKPYPLYGQIPKHSISDTIHYDAIFVVLCFVMAENKCRRRHPHRHQSRQNLLNLSQLPFYLYDAFNQTKNTTPIITHTHVTFFLLIL